MTEPDTKCKPKKLLVVDDIAAARRRYASILRHAGHEVTVAGDGKSALELACRSFFDLILLDLHMPDMKGEDVLYELRSAYARMREVVDVRDVPVLCVTGYGTEQAVSTVLLLGAAGVFHKPVDEGELLAAAEKLLAGESGAAGRLRKIAVVVDPAPQNRGLFRHIFEGMGWGVVEESDPGRLQALLSTSVPELMVVNLPSGTIDEERLVRRIASVIERVPVLLIAQDALQQARAAARIGGPAVILVRPLVLDTLIGAIEQAQQHLAAKAESPSDAPAPAA